jgi:hypothetical protein
LNLLVAVISIKGEFRMKRTLLITSIALLVAGTSYVMAGGRGRNGKRCNRTCAITGSVKTGSSVANRKGNGQRQQLRDGSGAGSQKQYKSTNGKKGQNNGKGQRLRDGSCVVPQNNFKGTAGNQGRNNARGQKLRDGSCIISQNNNKVTTGKKNSNNTQGQKPQNTPANTTSSTDK